MLYLFSLMLVLGQVQGLAIEPRDKKEPDWMSWSEKDIRDKYEHLYSGPTVNLGPGQEHESNPERYFDFHFASTQEYLEQYPGVMFRRKNGFHGKQPFMAASRLPGIGSSQDSYPYIASTSPARFGNPKEYIYWDMVRRGAGDNAILVDLVSYDTDFEAFKFFGTIADQRDDIFPNSTSKTRRFYPPTDDCGLVISRYDEAPYVVHFEDEQTWKDNNLEYRKLRLTYKSEPAHAIHYFYYTAWPNSQGIDPDKLEFMLERVNEKFTNQKIVGNCLWGKGRTGTWFEAWAIYQATVVAKSTEWFFSSPDPIKDYTVKIRHQRDNMIDSANQYVYLYQKWARQMWDRVSEKA